MWTPEVGTLLPVELPGEITRCRVSKILDRDTIIVEMVGISLSPAKLHTYTKHDLIGCRRKPSNNPTTNDKWVAVPNRPETLAPAIKAKAKRKKVKKAKKRAAR